MNSKLQASNVSKCSRNMQMNYDLTPDLHTSTYVHSVVVATMTNIYLPTDAQELGEQRRS
jgi:hypothetical protein